MGWDTKISRFFKQLTLSVAVHFVNSLPALPRPFAQTGRGIHGGYCESHQPIDVEIENRD